jgi:hypothetical protein
VAVLYIEAEIMRYFISGNGGNGGHLQFATNPDVRERHYSSAVLANLENVGAAFIIWLSSCTEAEITHYFTSTSGYLAAIIALRPSLISHSIKISPAVYLACENMGSVIVISLFSGVLAQIYDSHTLILPVYGRHLNLRFEHCHRLQSSNITKWPYLTE